MEKILQAKSYFSNFEGKGFRPGQEEAIRFICESPKKVVVICGPTGSGKSLVGMIAGQILTKGGDLGNFAYCAASKHLQAQLEREFPEAMVMQGRANFPCLQYTHMNAGQCTHSKRAPCEYRHKYPYEVHKRRVANHPTQILNYHYFLTEGNYVGIFSGYPILVADEGDGLESLLTDFVGLSVSRRILDNLVVEPPKYKTACPNGITDWVRWTETVLLPKVEQRIENFEAGIGVIPHRQVATELQALKSLETRARTFINSVDEEWICETTGWNGEIRSWKFAPTWLTPELAQANFFRHTNKVVLMSATFPPVHIIAKTLGVEAGVIDFMELPSTFPISNRPVYLSPVGDMSHKTFEDGLPEVVKEIKRLLDRHPREKGVIHTVSWKLNEAVMGICDPRLITHNTGDKGDALDRFINSEDPLVFVSPSSARGVDLPDDLCRFIILPKAPFQDLSSKLVSSRVWGSQTGVWWYRSLCAQEIVQACGRAVRHEKDYAVAYLVDKQISDLVVNSQSLFPKYWLEAVDIL